MKHWPTIAALAFPLCTLAQPAPSPLDTQNIGTFDGSTGIYQTCVIADGIGEGYWNVQMQGRDEAGLGPDMFSLELIAAEEAQFEECGTLFDPDTGEFLGLVMTTNTGQDFDQRTFLFEALVDPDTPGFKFITNLAESFVDVSEPQNDDEPQPERNVSAQISDPGGLTGQTLSFEFGQRPDVLDLSAPVCQATVEQGNAQVEIPVALALSASGLSVTPAGDTLQIATADLPVGSYSLSARCVATLGEQTYTSTEAASLTVRINSDTPSEPPNQAPSFTRGADQSVDEDAGAQTVSDWATDLSAGPAREAGQTLSFTLSNDNNALFAAQPAIDANGTLSYTPADNANGSATVTVTAQDNGGTGNGGQDTSAAQTFTITVNSVNDVPVFTKGADQSVNEDAGAQNINDWATGISAGTDKESDQTLSFNVSNDNNALFATQPAIATNGTLSYTPADNISGSATVTVALQDDGGTTNGGSDTSATQTFTITVTASNDAPSFTKGNDQSVLEDAGAQSNVNWASNISAGAPDEAGQTLTFDIGNDNNALFAVQPALSVNGTLTYTPASNAFGSATVTVNLQDNGGTANGGVDTSADQTFTITVNAVNDAPTITRGDNVTVNEDAGAQNFNNWATNISVGPTNEQAGQSITGIVVTNSNNALFAVQPAISNDGTLTFTSADNANGEAIITVLAQDDGGTANGGSDTSEPTQRTITVTSVNDAPVAEAQSLTIEEDKPTLITLRGTDVEGGSLTFAIVTPPSTGTLGTVNPDPGNPQQATVTYTGVADDLDESTNEYTTTFTFSTTDIHGSVSEADVDLTVQAINDRPTIEINSESFTFASEREVIAEPNDPITVNGPTYMLLAHEDDESREADGDQRGFYYFRLEVISIPDSASSRQRNVDNGIAANKAFEWRNYDPNQIASDSVAVPPNFDEDYFGYIQHQTLVSRAGLVMEDFEFRAHYDGEYVLRYTMIDNGFSGRCPAELDTPVADDPSFAITDYRSLIGRNGELLNNDPRRCIRESSFDITINNTVPEGETQNSIFVDGGNSAPELTVSTVTVDEDSGPYSAVVASPGPGTFEAQQNLSVTVTNNTNPGLFQTAPAIAADGTLTFTPAANASGEAELTLELSDDGYAEPFNYSVATETLTIRVTEVADPP